MVVLPADLKAVGWTSGGIAAQLAARRWQRAGRAIVKHDGSLTREETIRASLLNAGRRALLTAFTAAEVLGLRGWERTRIHLLIPGGTRVRRLPGVDIHVHYTTNWDSTDRLIGRPVHSFAPALVLAAGTLSKPGPACGLLAAAVQQRLVRPIALRSALEATPRIRHSRILSAALDDIEQGAQALSEIDFARLCRRHGLPEPTRQAIRTDRLGRRRYLDAEWVRPDGQRVVVEVDGALHLAVNRWWDDQSRQNELAIGGDLVLRYPSVIVRTQPGVVVDQLRRALRI